MPAIRTPNIEAFRAFLKNRTHEKHAVTGVTAVTPIKSSTSRLQGLVTLVTGAPTPEKERRAQLLEREAFAAVEGGVHPTFITGFAKLQMSQPAGTKEAVWHQAINDAGLFLDRFGAKAAAFGWSPDDVFSEFGLAWTLKGSTVADITTTSASLSDGRTFHLFGSPE
ncbi:hypothetical protein [Microvirga aerophila]|uniref:Uncharacterized protein n=1 Tax=Microvirga aerophila TaxID=670291 RepID=A0A512C3J5_9HYPH|nr:hypothetical protein [Microvirga aerophila]GEO18617.1 hypothetical protein MAE02_63130 [Microvirga aerophila]